MTADNRVDTYKRLRTAYQQTGNRREASRYYYKERLSELTGSFCPLLPRDGTFPFLTYPGSLAELVERTRAGQFTSRQARHLVVGNVLAALQVLSPKFLSRFVVRLTRGPGKLLDWSLWGFGERPARVFPWMLLILCLFAAKYFSLGGRDGALRGRVLDSFYCSAFNFSTMGCDYKTSFDSIEGVAGAVLLGLMVAGFANKTRY